MKKLSLISVIVIIAISLNSCKNPVEKLSGNPVEKIEKNPMEKIEKKSVEKLEGKWITKIWGDVIVDIKVSKDSLFFVMEKIEEYKYKVDSTKMDTVFLSSGSYNCKLWTVKDTLFQVPNILKLKFVRYKK